MGYISLMKKEKPPRPGFRGGFSVQGLLPRGDFSVAHEEDMVLPSLGQYQKPQKTEGDTVLNTMERLLAFQRLNREWRPHLTPAERDFLGWFLDNTICWGRENLRVTVKQMAEGTRWLKTCCIPERSLWRIIKTLKQKGVLAVRSCGAVNEFVINLMWKAEDMLRVPKRLTGEQSTQEATQPELDIWAEEEQAASSANVAGTARHIGMPNKGDVDKQEVSEETNSGAPHRASQPPAFALVRQRIRPVAPAKPIQPVSSRPAPDAPKPSLTETAAGAIKAVIAKATAKRETKPLTLWTSWKAGWEQGFDGVPVKALGKAEMGMLGGVRQRYSRSSLDFNDFLHWSVCNWREVMAEKFEWMTREPPPSYPDARFFVKFADRFLDMYSHRKERERMKTAPAERAEYQKLRASGMSHDDALIEIGKRRAASAERDELAKEREYVNSMFRVIEAEKKKVARMAQAAATPAAPRTTKPVIKHGDNPFEQENPEILDFSKLDLRWED